MDLTQKEQDTVDDMDLFLMGICHQSYETLPKIPLDKKTRLLKRFGKIVEMLFHTKGNKSEIINVIKGITDPNEYIRQQKEKQKS